MSSLIDDLDGVKQIDKAISENADLQQQYVAGRSREVDLYTAALAEHEAAVDVALNAGEPPPDAPPEPASEQVHFDRLTMFARRASMLAERRLAAIAANAPDIDLLTSAAYGDLIQEAKRPVGTLKRIAADIAALQNVRHEVACAVIAVDPQRGQGASRPPAPGKVTAESVVAAVQRGVDLLEIQTERHLGMSNSNLHEIHEPPPGSEPAPGMKHVRRTSATLGMYRPR
jgi:hypothetical protein